MIEFFYRLKIIASPFLVGIVLGVILYLYKPDETGIIIGSIIAILGLDIGIILSIIISRKIGAAKFNSALYSTPDLDKLDEGKTK